MHIRQLSLATALLGLLLLPAANAETICFVDCTVEVSLPPEPGAGVNVAGVGSEHVYLYGCTDTFDQEVFCVHTAGILGVQGAHMACPIEDEPACYYASGTNVGSVLQAFLGLVVIAEPGHPCVISGAAAQFAWIYQVVVCVPYDHTVSTDPSSPSVCVAASVEDERYTSAGPFTCAGALIDQQPICVTVFAGAEDVQVVCQARANLA